MISYRIYLPAFLYLQFLVLPVSLKGQLPQTNLYSVTVENPLDSVWKISSVQFLNSFNLHGYTNQPFHINENEILCTVRKPDETDTDIYHLHIKNSTLRKVTHTSASEYSPRIYVQDQKYFTVVKVPEDDSTIQVLSLYNLISGEESRSVLSKHGKIGYYRKIKQNQWICFLVEKDNLFAICQENPPTRKVFASGIGRAFELLDENKLLFVQKGTNNIALLKSYSIPDEKIETWTTMPSGTEDFVLLEDGSVLCAQGSRLMKFTYQKARWQIVADFSVLGLSNINRLSIRGKNLIMVTGK